MSIGSNIKKLRESRNLTQKELADIIGVSDKAVSTWELDIKIPRMGAIQKLADYFGVQKSDLIEDNTRNKNANPTDEDIKFALFGGEDGISDAAYEEVKNFARFIKEKYKNDKST